MKSEDYKRGVEDALEWMTENGQTEHNLDYLKRGFWTDHQQLTDDDRYEAFLKGADAFVRDLKELLRNIEEGRPDTFCEDPSWRANYLCYVQAKTLKGETV